MMAKELTQRIIGTVQSGLNSTVHSLQAAVQNPSQGSAFYPSTLDQLENVKSGWLRKHGGIVKSWHRRYFVMKGDYVYYFNSDEDFVSGKPPLGSIFLPGNHVIEIPFTPGDTEKFQFEIQTAETDDERKDWIRAIKQFLYSVSGGAIFGQSLEETLQYEQKLDKSRKVPHIVQCCITYLRENSLHEEGLFRLPGRSVVIRQLQEMFDRGERPTMTADDPADVVLDTHTVASLLKLYLRELPEPLVPYDMYESVMTIITREVPIVGERRAAAKLGDLLAARLSPANYNTLQCVCQFLADVASCSDDNKMNVTNLATVFALCFLRPDAGDDPGLMLATQANRSTAAQLMISQCSKIFRLEYTPTGAAIVTADLLGLDARSSALVSRSSLTLPPVNCGSQDLIGLDFGSPQPPSRHSSLTRPRPAERQSTHRSGIVDQVQTQRDAVLFDDDSLDCRTTINGTVPASTDDASCVLRERPVKDDKKAEKPVAARRAVRSSSFDGRLPNSTAEPQAPVPPPKPNRQRVALNAAILCSRIEELTAQLKSTEEERDAALAKVAELESKLDRYYETYGDID